MRAFIRLIEPIQERMVKIPMESNKKPVTGPERVYKPYTAREQKTGARTPAGDMQKIITRIQQIEAPALLAKISVFVESRIDDMEEKHMNENTNTFGVIMWAAVQA